MRTANEYIVSSKRLGAMTMSAEPSELTILKSEHLTDFERRFFVDNIVVKSIEFSGAANAQIFCRCMIHDLSRAVGGQMLPSTVARGSETVLCVHAFRKMTTSWTWVKFATTLYRAGFNVIMMDLPGFGRSSIMRDIRCPISTWDHWQVQMFTTFLGQMGISRVNMMGCYESASFFLDVLLHAPHFLSGNHFLHNPLFSRAQLAEPRYSGILKALLSGGLKRRIFATFDRTRYPDPHSKDFRSLSEETIESLIASERVLRQVSKSVGFNQVTMSQVSSSDMAEVCFYEALDQPGLLPVFGLYPSQKFRVYILNFMSGESQVPFTSNEAVARVVVGQTASLPQSGGSAESHNSFGARVRRMEEEAVLEAALLLSEKDFLGTFGEDNLLHQQALSEGLSHSTQSPKANVGEDSLGGEFLASLISGQKAIEDELAKNLNSAKAGAIVPLQAHKRHT